MRHAPESPKVSWCEAFRHKPSQDWHPEEWQSKEIKEEVSALRTDTPNVRSGAGQWNTKDSRKITTETTKMKAAIISAPP